MAEVQTVQVTRMLDAGGIRPFHIKLLVWSLLLVIIDGYDIGAIAFALPSLIKGWGISPRDLGPVLSLGIVGMLLGSAFFGFVGDRYGRKTALVIASVLFGVLTYAAAYAVDLTQLTWLRFTAGVGIGGIIPNVIAINAESAPRRYRATLALVAIGLVPLGGVIAGLVGTTLVPTYGWQLLFYIGGVAPVLIGILCLVALPESIKFMALHEKYRSQMEKVLRQITPNFIVPPGAKFIVEDERNFTNFNPSLLFRNGLAIMTPLTWLIMALNLMGFYFLTSWTPTLLVTAAHLPPQTGALAGTMLLLGGTIGPLLLCRWMDKQRFLSLTILFFLAVPVVGSLGWFGVTSQVTLMAAAFLTGFVVLSIQTGLNVTGALIYPTSVRTNGSGWQLGIGRLGSIIGPLLGAAFVGLPVQDLYLWAATPFIVGAIACFVLYRLDAARLKRMPVVSDGAALPLQAK
jgi:MFS transporter, AAHS family, 4-hydroxybenzoate transporter